MSAAPFSATARGLFPARADGHFILPPALCHQARRRIIIVGTWV
ncbi:hypothetical protein FORC31_p471 (plasmid) [Escherichia coli]|nr:hypothetical protein FORC31_p471 [Escherichia coli]